MTRSQPRPFPITSRSVFAIAVPMTLAYATTPLLGLTDTAVAGRLGEAAAIGGLATGAVLVDLVFTSFNFQRASTTGLAAQAHGAEDRAETQAVLLRALAVAVVLGLATLLLAVPLAALGLKLMAPAPTIAGIAQAYVLVRLLGAPLTLANYALLGWVVGVGRSGLGLALQVLLNGANIVLSVWLGLGLGWGVQGIALASVMAEGVGLAAGLLVAWWLNRGGWAVSRGHLLDRAALARLVSMNGDIMVRSFLLLGAFTLFTARGGHLGEVTLAANAILMNVFLLGAYCLDGLATAAEQIAGRAVGARWREGFVRGLWLTGVWTLAISLVISLAILLAGPLILAGMTTLESVRAEGARWLWLAALTPLTGAIAFQLDGVFIGATWTRAMLVSMVASFALYAVLLWLLAPTGNLGLWAALHAFLLSRGVTLAALIPGRLRRTFGTAAAVS